MSNLNTDTLLENAMALKKLARYSASSVEDIDLYAFTNKMCARAINKYLSGMFVLLADIIAAGNFIEFIKTLDGLIFDQYAMYDYACCYHSDTNV